MSVSREASQRALRATGRRGSHPRPDDAVAEPLEEREVRASDPALTPETNERLTHELRDVIGAERVRVPRERAHPSQGERPRDRGFGAFWSVNRMSLTIAFVVALTFGAIIALTTGYWWILGIAAAVHALGTTGVYLLAWRTMTISEHPSPTVAAAMAEEGILTPDSAFSQMVDEFRPEPSPSVGDTLAPETGDRPTPASIDPARAGAEEAAALTATSGPSHAVRFGGPTDFMIWTIDFGLAVASIVIAAVFGGGWLWLAPGLVVPLATGLSVLMWLMDQRPEAVHARSWRPLGMVVAGTAITVGVFCALIALFIH